jgi:hypothetical protein
MKLSDIESSGTDFFKFFNIHQVAEIPLLGISVIKKFKPGGFQESIDLEITENELGELLSAGLQLNRTWIGNVQKINPFATDIAKSFLHAFIPPKIHNELKTFIDFIEFAHGTQDRIIHISGKQPSLGTPSPEIRHFLEVFVGNEVQYVRDYSICKIAFTNLNMKNRDFLEIGIIYQYY